MDRAIASDGVRGQDEGEAWKKMLEAQRQAEHGIEPPAARLTVGQYLDRRLEGGVKPGVRPAMFECYSLHVRRHLGPALVTCS